ncbi:MAG: hypothetical protein COS34_13305, partial [Lysobacterales bacterium CG02_land_8_20_14_3_00_62_12]
MAWATAQTPACFVGFPLSVFGLLPFIFCVLFSVFCPPSSVLCRLSSVFCLLNRILASMACSTFPNFGGASAAVEANHDSGQRAAKTRPGPARDPRMGGIHQRGDCRRWRRARAL